MPQLGLAKRSFARLILAITLGTTSGDAVAQTADPWDNRRPPYSSVWFTPFTDPLDDRIEKLMAMVEGEYRGKWPGAFAKRPDVEEVPAWAVWKRIKLPAFGSRVFFMEIREGGPTGRILRQRIVEFSDDPLRSHNYVLHYILLDFERYARADLDPSKLASLTRESLAIKTRGCQCNIIGDGDGFAVGVDKSSCVFLYPDGKARYNEFRFRFDEEGFSFFEAAYDLDGKFLAGAVRPVGFARVKG